MLTKTQKGEMIAQLAKKISETSYIIFIRYTKIPVAAIASLRKELEAKGSNLKMVKKTLADLSLQQAGIQGVSLKDNFKGSIGIVFASDDIFGTLGLLSNFQKKNKDRFEILGAILNKEYNDKARVMNLAAFSSPESVYASLVSTLNANIQKLVSVLGQINK